MTYVVRHAVSKANDRNNPAFGNPDAGLIPFGVEQAVAMGERFNSLGYPDRSEIPVAVSKMKRTWQTANAAGFFTLRQYGLLGELDLSLEEKMDIKQAWKPSDEKKAEETRKNWPEIREQIIPERFTNETRYLLNNRPQEDIWITHGLRARAIFNLLGLYQDYDEFIMGFTEIRKLPDNWQEHPNLRYNTH